MRFGRRQGPLPPRTWERRQLLSIPDLAHEPGEVSQLPRLSHLAVREPVDVQLVHGEWAARALLSEEFAGMRAFDADPGADPVAGAESVFEMNLEVG